jgi:Lon protease-like protein
MSVYELPLFPLNTVLFPGMPLHLHIFEERYKKMINMCIERSVSFGVVLIQHGREAHGPLAEPYGVGSTARIVEIQPLSEGRMNVIAIGHERFRTMLLNRDKAPYLTGILEPYPLTEGDPELANQECSRLKPRLKRYLQLLSEAGGVDLELPNLPDEPAALAFLAAITLQVSNQEKQQFLDTERTTEMLQKLQNTYRREISLLQSLGVNTAPDSMGSFSKN